MLNTTHSLSYILGIKSHSNKCLFSFHLAVGLKCLPPFSFKSSVACVRSLLSGPSSTGCWWSIPTHSWTHFYITWFLECLWCLLVPGLSLSVGTPPQWCPEPSAPPTRCPGVRGPGNHGPSGWSQTPSCGAPHSRWQCLTHRWCWTYPQRRWAAGPTPPGGDAAPDPQEREVEALNTTSGSCGVMMI